MHKGTKAKGLTRGVETQLHSQDLRPRLHQLKRRDTYLVGP